MASPPKRRWFAFRLRTLLIVVVVLGLALTPLAMKLKKARAQKVAVEWVLENDGSVFYDWQLDDGSGIRPGPEWLRRLIGDEFFQTVRGVDFQLPLAMIVAMEYADYEGIDPLDLSRLAEFDELQILVIMGKRVEDLSPLNELLDLKYLKIRAHVTDKEVARLQKALPNCEIIR